MTMTLNRLTEIKQKNQELVMVRKLVASQAEEMAKHTAYRKQILVCGGTGCTSSGSKKVIDALEKELKAKGIEDVLVVKTGCFGLCALGPILIVYPEGAFYSQTTPEGAKRIIDEHIINGNICKDLLYPETVHEDGEDEAEHHADGESEPRLEKRRHRMRPDEREVAHQRGDHGDGARQHERRDETERAGSLPYGEHGGNRDGGHGLLFGGQAHSVSLRWHYPDQVGGSGPRWTQSQPACASSPIEL